MIPVDDFPLFDNDRCPHRRNSYPRTIYFVDKYSNEVYTSVVYGEFFDPEDGVCVDARDLLFAGYIDHFDFTPDDGFVRIGDLYERIL